MTVSSVDLSRHVLPKRLIFAEPQAEIRAGLPVSYLSSIPVGVQVSEEFTMNRVRLQIVCICIFFGAVIATGMEALTPGPPKARRSTTGLKEAEPRAMRPEGERFSANGKIEQTGDRYTFYPSDDGPSLRILENLGLDA